MTSSLDIIGILTAFIFFIVIIVLTKKKSPYNSGNKLFALFLLINLIIITLSLLYRNQLLVPRNFPIFYFSIASLFFLFGPLLYFYFLKIVSQTRLKSSKLIVHLIPAITSALILTVSYYIRIEGSVDNSATHLWTNTSYHIYLASVNIQILVYLILTIRAVRRYFNTAKDNFSELTKLKTSWYLLVLSVFIIHWLLDLFTSYSIIWFRQFTSTLEFLSIAALLVFAVIIIYRGLQSESIFFKLDEKEKYSNSAITELQKNEYVERINEFMKNEKPYLSPGLTLNELAELIEIQPKYLSQIINESFKLNFFDFINSYRIDEAKSKLEQMNGNNGHKTILELLYEVGFNSKSAFNRAFKKQLGLTPTEFRKTLIT
ncbi:MAG: helix-turn-helix transcriptional regulator [Ignavibacteriae bacterium]|nr:AraC family transcriptional regulator [Ignavibacteriota bacterium]NOG99574.1 helix-turn-helix transcriptional regulator [Ignavibacteriota bacterium]